MKSATALASWVRVICRVLQQRGHDAQTLMQAAGLAVEVPAHARYPLSATTRLWRLAVAASGDEALGLAVASAVKPGTFLVLEVSLGASRNLKEVFERIVRYFQVVSDAAELRFERVGGEYHFSVLPLLERSALESAQPAPEAIDAFMSLFIRMSRALLGAEFSPLGLSLCRPEPENRARFEQILRTPLDFAAEANLLRLAAADCERPLPGADPELAREGDALVRRYLARHQQENILAQVQAALVEQLPRGEPDQAQIARQLHLSPRSLQRRLAEQNSSYRQLLDRTRRELADAYLQDPKYSLVEITYLLGYGDSSNFTRACRRWFGCTPSQYRLQCRK